MTTDTEIKNFLSVWRDPSSRRLGVALFAAAAVIVVLVGCNTSPTLRSGPLTTDWPTIPGTDVQVSSGSVATVGLPAGQISLCLSGGGYRAMLFHAGVIWR